MQEQVDGGGRPLGVAAAGTLLALVAFTAPIATLNSTVRTRRRPVRPHLDPQVDEHRPQAALLSTGTVADDFGRRRTFVVGCLVLALGSLLGAVAPTAVLFVLCRVVQGVGAAAVIASSLASSR